VPALTFGVSTNFALANFLASRSFGNVLVSLTRFRFPRGSSNETYHVPLDLLAMIPSRGLRRRLTDRGPQSKANEIVPLATCQPSGFVFRHGRCRTAFRARTHQRCSWSLGRSAIHPSSASAFPSPFLYDQLTFVRRCGSERAAPRRAHASAVRGFPPPSIAPLSPLAIHPIAGFCPVMP
jgi:hypothetical protein